MREPRLWPVCLSVAEWSRSLGVQRATLYEWHRQGLPIFKIGTKRKIFTDDLTTWAKAHLPKLEPSK